MKAILLATALSLAVGSAAIAQDSMSPAAQQPSNGQTPADTSGAPASSMGDSGTPAAAPMTPDASAPAPATTPAPSMGADAAAAPAAATTDYPACSKAVTDKCVEKGGMKAKAKKKR